jgi:branched-chain amino acid transport system substrate-binding protein
MKKRSFARLVSTSLVALALAGLAPGISPAADKAPIRVAHVGATSGIFSSLGVGGKQAMELWESQVNAKGGILGRPVKVMYYDTMAKPANAVEMLKKAVYEDKADFIISTDSSGVVLASYPVMKELKKVYISGSGAAEEMQNTTNRYCFHASHSSRTFGYAMAKLLHDKYPNVKKVVGVNPDYAWGRSVWAAFKESFKTFQPAAEFPLELWPPFGTLDFKPYISQIMALPDLGQVAVHTSLWSGDQVTFDKQARTFGMFGKIAAFLDDSSTNLDVQMALGADGVAGWGTSHYSHLTDSPSNKAFVKAYQAKFGKTALPTSAGGGTYRAAQFLQAAIAKAGTVDTDAVVKALEGLKLKDTVSGPSYIREWDHIVITPMVLGEAFKDPKFPYWTWKNPYVIKAEEVEKVIPKERYKGWRGNQ